MNSFLRVHPTLFLTYINYQPIEGKPMTTTKTKKPVSEMTIAEYKAHNAELIRWFTANPHAIPKTDLLIDSAELAPSPDSVEE
jgi:hypothetical protein